MVVAHLLGRSPAADGGRLAGSATLDVWEVTNTAVVESQRGRGAGRALLERAISEARAARVRRVILATGAADIGNLRFYQRCGFRMTRIVQDAFTSENGYPAGLEVRGSCGLYPAWFTRCRWGTPARRPLERAR